LHLAASQDRDLSEEECAAFDVLKARIAAASGSIDRETTLIAEDAQSAIAMIGMGPSGSAGSVITVSDNRELDSKHGFQSVGEFPKTVCQAQKHGNAIDERLFIGAGRGAAAPTNFGNEGSAQDGGFLVPPQFANEIFSFPWASACRPRKTPLGQQHHAALLSSHRAL